MAKNYTLAEAAKIIAEGKDLAAIAELGKRFSLLTVSLASITALAGDNFTSFVSKFPENITANKVNGWLKNSADVSADVSEDDADEDSDEDNDSDTSEDSDEEEKDLDSMTTKELKALARKMKVFKNAKSSKKEDLIAAIQAANGGADDADEDEDEESTNPYEGKSAMELFKECKERGIKAAPKKPAKFYIDLLLKADADSTDSDEEDWDDEEEEEPTPAPKKKSSKAAPAKAKNAKTAKKPEPEEEDEDGDDWDI